MRQGSPRLPIGSEPNPARLGADAPLSATGSRLHVSRSKGATPGTGSWPSAVRSLSQEHPRPRTQLAEAGASAGAEAERDRYRTLSDLIPDGCLATDPTGTIREANRAAAALLH